MAMFEVDAAAQGALAATLVICAVPVLILLPVPMLFSLSKQEGKGSGRPSQALQILVSFAAGGLLGASRSRSHLPIVTNLVDARVMADP